MASYFVLHVSDLHFGEDAGVVNAYDARNRHHWRPGRMPELWRLTSHSDLAAEALTRFVVEYEQEVDLVLITGDLATSGMAGDLDAAHRFVADLAGQVSKPIGLIPGNHDRYRTGVDVRPRRACSPGGSAFDAVFQSRWPVGKSAGLIFAAERDGRPLIIIGADLTLREGDFGTGSKYAHFGQGHAYEERLRDLAARTRDAQQEHENAAVIWAVHFAPRYPSIDRGLALLESDRLLTLAEELGVSHILCGHTHTPKVYSSGAFPSVEVHCAGTATHAACGSGNWIHLYAIEVDADGAFISEERFQLDAGEGAFMKVV